MTTAKTNVYRDGAVWCHATWIDGEFDCSDAIGIDDDSTDDEAIAAAKSLFEGIESHDVNIVADNT